MHGQDVFGYQTVRPLARFGFTHYFWDMHIETIIRTWAVIALILILALLARYTLQKKDGVGQFLVLSFVNWFKDLSIQTLGRFYYVHFAMVTALFTFILMCNAISIIPWLEEPTKDLNTTLAVGLISFLYAQANAIKTHGLKEYIKGYFAPFILMFPLNVIGNIASIVSISFRLFGNIFGGSIISQLYTQAIAGNVLSEMLGILSGINITITLFFGLFEGFIQAFVFAMLSLTYLSMAIASSEAQGSES